MDLSILSSVIGPFFSFLIFTVPAGLIKLFSDPNIPTNSVKFDEKYEKRIEKIENHSLLALSEQFEKAVEHEKDISGTHEDELKDELYLDHLKNQEKFFIGLNKYNVKLYEHKRVRNLYDCLKELHDNFYKCYTITFILGVISFIATIINQNFYYLIILALFPFIESLRILYNLKGVYYKIKKVGKCIDDDYDECKSHSIFS